MHTPLPFFNWSFKRAVASLPDSFTKARVRIIYIILLFSLAKALLVIGFAIPFAQWLQLTRAVIAFFVYTVMLKLLLNDPSRLRVISHIMLSAGIVVIWSNILFYTHRINLPSMQFIFMVILASFYTLGRKEGIVYSILAIIPVILMLIAGQGELLLTRIPEELPSPGFEILVALNFLTITLSHYYFYTAFDLNIREKEALNKQLAIAASDAKQLAESRSNFLSTMSHELRTPLNSVVGISELLLQGSHGDTQKENLDLLQYSALDLLSLINNILDINKLDSEKLQLETTPFNLYKLVNNVCAVLRIKARDKKLSLLLEVDESLKNVTVTSDPTRLSQVIYNLVGNAIKFTEQGSVTVRLQRTEEVEGRINVLFSVTDTGIGIPTERHDSIFESFSQADPGTTRRYGGTGLGLTIVKQVLTLFNSQIELESAPGKGSRFFFQISFVVSDTSNVAISEDPDINLSHLRILVAEDNDVNKLVLQKQLRNLDITPVIVHDGLQAYEAYVNGSYDAVLLDLDMPGWDGYETSKNIRLYAGEKKQDAYLIAFTASMLDQQHLSETNFDDFLYKPVSMKELKEKLVKVATRNNASPVL
jgi:signal transduction histidine kinase/CheY-like chemotaxis protein